DDCRWMAMRELADHAEERGEATLAAGWRWLADHHKWPVLQRRYAQRPARGEPEREGLSACWVLARRDSPVPFVLPDPGPSGGLRTHYPTEVAALAAAAGAVGAWLGTRQGG